MMISNTTAAVVSILSNRSGTSMDAGSAANGFGPEYQVDLSSSGLALSNSATGVTESRMRNVLTRILLETLFGMDANANPDKSETSRDEMVREVVVDPTVNTALQKMTISRQA
ncbi:MAG: hypothetical protein HQL95_12945 [Magnetococcales bacterium]|nr:hypothetical protein [Magnetococcales bacterium]